MEREHGNFPKPEENSGKKDGDNTTRDKRDGVLVVSREKEPTPNLRKRDAKPLYEALADSLLTKDDSVNTHSGTLHETVREKPNENKEKDAFEDKRELNAHEVYIGEGVLMLEGAGIEHEIPLYPEAEEMSTDDTIVLEEEPEKPTPEHDVPPTSEPEMSPAETLDEEAQSGEVNSIVPNETAPDLEQTVSGGDVPPTEPPETTPAFSAPEPPERPHVPVYNVEATPVPHYEQNIPAQELLNPNLVQNTEKPLARQVEEAYYYGQKEGQRRGVLAGAFVAGMYEHYKHKRREKKLTKVQKKQQRDIEHLTQQQSYLQEEATGKHPTYEERLNNVVQKLEQPPRPPELPAETPKAPNLELLKQLQPEHAARIQAATEEPATIPPEHRIETSAWHRIEMDAKTGKVVDDPTFEYGHEYYRERHQEAAPHDQQVHEAAGEVALVANAMSQSDEDEPEEKSSMPTIPLATIKKNTAKAKDFAQTTAKTMVQSDGPLWPYYVVLGVILVLILLFS